VGKPLTVGLVGAGNISGAYLTTLATMSNLRVVAVADLDPGRAEVAASHTAGARVMTLDELIVSSEVDVVLNLTVPEAHAQVALAALAAGKHTYSEKPLAATRDDALQILTAAAATGLRVGCAPDTVLGTGIQSARRAVEDGLIGSPVSATAIMASFGHERWHPNPEFYYVPGGGPLLDMGPYYLSALIHLLGPVKSVTGASSRPRPTRTIERGPRAGTTFDTEIDTHITGILEHRNGALTTILMSFDMAGTQAAPLEIHGTSGSLVAPDPNRFDGGSMIKRAGETEWLPLPISAGFQAASRGYGLAEMAQALQDGRPHRASADLAYHVLDVSITLLRAAKEETSCRVESTCELPTLVPLSVQRDSCTPTAEPATRTVRPANRGPVGG
jgi:predicted dehydrogenase